MLVLKRKYGERIILHGGPLRVPVVFTLIDRSTSGVRIGVDAQADITVDREEIYTRRGEWKTRKGG